MLSMRPAGLDDVPTLARLNEQLIEDEGHDNPLRGRALADRFRGWFEADYRAALGMIDAEPAVYALWRADEDNGIYLRQFFVARQYRRLGVGRTATRILREEHWQPATRIRLDVLVGNQRGHTFWQSVGFQDYSIIMEHSQAPENGAAS